jgi:predicted heme/steroid binding protein
MLAIAVLTNTYIDRRLRRESAQRREGGASNADGQEGRPAHVIFQGRRYDVTASKMWKNGVHMGRHRAGGDLTETLGDAPHGPEVLSRVPDLGPVADSDDGPALSPANRLLVVLANLVLVCMLVILFCLAWWRWGPPLVAAAPAWDRTSAASCLACHQKATPAVGVAWAGSAHARAGVSCLHCHLTTGDDPTRSRAHASLAENIITPPPVRVLVSPKNCAACHPRPAREFAASKHAGTLEIINQVDALLASCEVNDLERATGCRPCHGGKVRASSRGLDPATWPDVGIGRLNPDGSRGNCAACHFRHTFSLADARRPHTCGQCHQGPDQPQYEIWRESKHGARYFAQGADWNFLPPPETWTAGLDYRAPTCAACHISGSGNEPASHLVSGRLSWENQTPMSVRPRDFTPWPAQENWPEARAAMKKVCLRCHANQWVDGHFSRYDQAVHLYNQQYYYPVAKFMERWARDREPWKLDIITSRRWTEFNEMWRREGRRARMGAAMMAPDYSWWHGFYELKKRTVQLMHAKP